MNDLEISDWFLTISVLVVFGGVAVHQQLKGRADFFDLMDADRKTQPVLFWTFHLLWIFAGLAFLALASWSLYAKANGIR